MGEMRDTHDQVFKLCRQHDEDRAPIKPTLKRERKSKITFTKHTMITWHVLLETFL